MTWPSKPGTSLPLPVPRRPRSDTLQGPLGHKLGADSRNADPMDCHCPQRLTSAVQSSRAWGRRNLEEETQHPSAQPRKSWCAICGVRTVGSQVSASRTAHRTSPVRLPAPRVSAAAELRQLRRGTSLHLTLRIGKWIQRSFSGSSTHGRISHSSPTGAPEVPRPRVPPQTQGTLSLQLFPSSAVEQKGPAAPPTNPGAHSPSAPALCTHGLRALTRRARLASVAATHTSRVLVERREVAWDAGSCSEPPLSQACPAHCPR